jgi:hypothetical protein
VPLHPSPPSDHYPCASPLDLGYAAPMTDLETNQLFERYSRAEISSIELRRALGDVGYADVIIGLAQRNLPFPQAPQAGREERIARAAALLFPKHE